MIREMTDQCQRTLVLSGIPQRIVSLVPSQTELLHALGLDERVVGITRFCTHPDVWYHSKSRVGGTKDFDLEKIRSLNPDLIVANKEENDREKIEQLATEFPVWISDVRTIDQAIQMILEVGKMTAQQAESEHIAMQIGTRFKLISGQKPIRAAYLIWNKPLMTVGHDTFIHALMENAGYENVFGSSTWRYPIITTEDLQMAQPDLLMLSSEPFPFQSSHKEDFQRLLPETEIRMVDGRNWSWYGSALLEFDPLK